MSSRSSVCKKRSRPADAETSHVCPNATAIVALKREIFELNKTLDAERKRRVASPLACGHAERHACKPSSSGDSRCEAQECVSRELAWCRAELARTKDALFEACEETEAMRICLSSVRDERDALRSARAEAESAEGSADSSSSAPKFDWVGRSYLAVSLPEEHTFRPGQHVTPARVLQKLFEIRVGDKLSARFGVLLENTNLMLSRMEPEWYAKHFAFGSTRAHGNGYVSAARVDVEDFAWLSFEYRAHAPLVEVLAGLLNVLSSTGKGGVTTEALHTSKAAYRSYFTLFKDAVSTAYEGFSKVRDRARKAREAQGSVYVPVTQGLADDCGRCRRAQRNAAARSVLQGLDAPEHIRCARSPEPARDELQLDLSLSSFAKLRGLRSGAGRREGSDSGEQPCTVEGTVPVYATGLLADRVVCSPPPQTNE